MRSDASERMVTVVFLFAVALVAALSAVLA